MIPENKQAAVAEALQKAFGVNEYEQIQLLTKGLSGSLISKITVHGEPYLLRVITNERDNPSQYFESMQMAANAGIAPAIRYLNSADRISITDFIEEKPFPISVAADQMADVLKHLHALTGSDRPLPYVDAADNFVKRFRASGLIPETALNDVYDAYETISRTYPRYDPENQVLCHNDLKPDNIIFDGVKPWLVDWEAARLNDRYLDLVAIANFVIRSEKEEINFLERYFEESVDDYKRARFFLMSNIVHLFCFALCALSAADGKIIDNTLPSADFYEFHDRLWKGEIDLKNKEAKMQYALVHLKEYKRKIKTKRFGESLYIVSEKGAGDL